MAKDRLVLGRRKACCVMLFGLPPLFMFLAVLQYILTPHGLREGPQFWDNFYYTTNKADEVDLTKYGGVGRFPSTYLAGSKDLPGNASSLNVDVAVASQLRGVDLRFASLFKCITEKNDNGDHYTKIAIIAPQPEVRSEAQKFFESYFLEQTGLNLLAQVEGRAKLQIATYDSSAKLWQELESSTSREHCLAINFDEVDKVNFKYKVEVSVPNFQVPDTNKPLYNLLVRLPDLASWSTTLQGGSVAV